ncbi:MAG: DUF4126 domain-containing protein [Candidatus Dormibacteraceae bacterium]
MNPALLQLPAAFGLSGASGLNATLPLFLTSLLARMGYLHLDKPFDALSSDVAFYGLLVLGIVEFAADKIPWIDSAFHLVMLPVSAASGAVLFAASTGTVHHVHPGLLLVLSLLAGAVTAGSVHSTRTAARPVANVAFLGPVLSTIEDVIAVVLTLTAVLLPALIPLLLLILGLLVLLLFRRIRGRRPAHS